MIKEIAVSSGKREELIDITSEVARAVADSGVMEGEALLFVTHTTAAVTINENADAHVKRDLLVTLAKLIPHRGDYLHGEGNSDAHLKSSLFGASERLIIQNGRLVLGTWQGIYFAEFDGPRSRRATIRITGEK